MPLRDPARRWIKRLLYYGWRRHCPICGSRLRRFAAAGLDPRPDARCPVCGALERHRLLWLFLQRRTDLFDGRPRRMLHIAPERPLESRLRRIPGLDYLTADLNNRRAMVEMDVTNIDFPDDAFDVIHHSHVLEHVADDARALSELARVLAPGGWMIAQVPITTDRTIEDPAVTDPDERRRRFGQEDHVRRYGPDVADRIRAAGLIVETFGPGDILQADERAPIAVPENEVVFYCRKKVNEP